MRMLWIAPPLFLRSKATGAPALTVISAGSKRLSFITTARPPLGVPPGVSAGVGVAPGVGLASGVGDPATVLSPRPLSVGEAKGGADVSATAPSTDPRR